MRKDLATLILEIVFVMKAGMVFLTAHFVSLESMFHFKKLFFQLNHPLASYIWPILSIFGTDIWQNITNYFCTNFKQEQFKFHDWPIILFKGSWLFSINYPDILSPVYHYLIQGVSYNVCFNFWFLMIFRLSLPGIDWR